MRRGTKSGFSLIEALVAVLLLGIGIAATVKSMSAIIHTQGHEAEAEDMQRLAYRTYNEILSLNILPVGESQGDYTNLGEDRFVWRAQRTATATNNLDAIQVEVAPKDTGFAKPIRLEGLICNQKTGDSSK